MKPRERSYRSATAPITFGKIAPPMIAITMNDDAFFAHRPRPKIPSAKIVGNMIDMKKYVRNTHATDTQPSLAKINRQSAAAAVQYQPSTLYGVNFFRMALPVNRPIRKQRKPS